MSNSLNFPPRLDLAQRNTPLIPLRRLSSTLGGPTIWLKRDDLTDMLASGNKLRKLEFALAQAKQQGADTILTYGGVQSNHCRATAIVGARLGLQVHLLLRGDNPGNADGNLLLSHLCGARIQHISYRAFKNDLPDITEQIKKRYNSQEHKVYDLALGASDAVGLWGYIDCARELEQDCQKNGIKADHILCATGSGGTLGGLIIGNATFNLGAQVWGVNVCDNAEYFQQKIDEDFSQWKQQYKPSLDSKSLAIDIIEGYVGPGYAKADASVFSTIRQVAELEGIIFDPVYTGKAFHALLTEIEKGERFKNAKNIIFVHTGGLFGLFPQKENFLNQYS